MSYSYKCYSDTKDFMKKFVNAEEGAIIYGISKSRMVREKGEFMLGLCEQCIGDSLNSRQKSIIDRCVRKLYIDIARSKEKYIPVMSDFYDILMAQPEDEAKDIALSLELFVNGSLNIFNHQTNVDVDNRFTVYGMTVLSVRHSMRVI